MARDYQIVVDPIATPCDKRSTRREMMKSFKISDRTGKEPCGECHLQPGETCDICNATAAGAAKVDVEAEPVAVLNEEIRGFLYAVLGADTWIEAGAIWDGSPELRKAAHSIFSQKPIAGDPEIDKAKWTKDDEQVVFDDTNGLTKRIWHPHRGYWAYKTAVSLFKAEARIRELEANQLEWQDMDTAPLDGKHCILSVPTDGGFIYSVQGAYQSGQWNSAIGDDVKPMYWMPNVLHPRNDEPAK